MSMREDMVEITGNASVQNDNRGRLSVSDVVEDITKLKQLITAETALFKKMKLKEASALHDEKVRLISKIEIQKELIKRDASILGKGSGEDLENFKSAAKGMESAIRENFHEVLKAKEVNQRLVEAISVALDAQERRLNGYDRTGKEGSGGPAFSKYSPALTMNQTV